MPGRAIPFLPGCYYHIYNRGNNRSAVFQTPENYVQFLRGIKLYILPAADVIAYCLMPTHYHLLLRARDPDARQPAWSISAGMMRLGVSYTKTINGQRDRSGVLFEGRFKTKPIDDSQYLLQLCIYIHANPAKDGIVADPRDWPYSNYLEWLGQRGGTLANLEFIRSQFPEPEAYAECVGNYLALRNMPDAVSRYLETLEA